MLKPINKFCLHCKHKQVSEKAKEKFNELVFNLFIDCPQTDKRIFGCTTKFLDVDWDSFLIFVKQNESIPEEEREEILKEFVGD